MHHTQSASELTAVLLEPLGSGAGVWLRKDIKTITASIGDGLSQTMWEADEVCGLIGEAPTGQEVAEAFAPLWAELDRQETAGERPRVESIAAVMAAAVTATAREEGELFAFGGETLRATRGIAAGGAVVVGANAERVGVLDVLCTLVSELYDEWSGDGVPYAAGTHLRHDGVLYRVLQGHTSQPGWSPPVAPSLFSRVLGTDGGSGEPMPWVQPDSTNPYMRGDRVTHNGHTWESAIDANVWEPGVYGWTQLD